MVAVPAGFTLQPGPARRRAGAVGNCFHRAVFSGGRRLDDGRWIEQARRAHRRPAERTVLEREAADGPQAARGGGAAGRRVGRGGPLSSPVEPGEAEGLSSVLHRNIEALRRRRERDVKQADWQARLAERITRFSGSMVFVYCHLAALTIWIAWNVGLIPGLKPFDPSFVILATEASVEAIFLSTFILISQNRAAAAADRRDDLDLQINLLAEHEITKLLQLTAAIADRLGVHGAKSPALAELKQDVAPEAVLDRLEEDRAEDAR
jgi:uncharacterized membrane protein